MSIIGDQMSDIYYIVRSREELQRLNLFCHVSFELASEEELKKEFPNGLKHGYNLYKVIR